MNAPNFRWPVFLMGLLLLVGLAFFALLKDSRGLESGAGGSLVTATSESFELAPAAAPEGEDRAAAPQGRAVDGGTPSAAMGRSLRGTLRFSSDSRPAAGEKLSFFHGRDEEMTQVLTGSAGHFMTEAVVRPGVVRIGHVRLDEEGRGAGLALEPQFCLVPEGDAPVELDLLLREARGLQRVDAGRTAADVLARARVILAFAPLARQGEPLRSRA